jgi:hypothetical protein
MELPKRLWINKFMIRPGMLRPANFPPDNPETEYIRKDLLENFADAVRRYVCPTKDDAFCSRSELLKHLHDFEKMVK